MISPTRAELDQRLAATSELGRDTKGASSAEDIRLRTGTEDGRRVHVQLPRSADSQVRTVRTHAGPTFIKASELITRELPALTWGIPGIQPAGLSILAGRPKLGKTSLINEVGIARAAGGRALGHIQVKPADVLLALLEDTPRRIKSRLELHLEGAPCPERLSIATTWPRLDQGGLEWAEAWGKKHRGGDMWFDTWARIRPAASRNGTLYQDDYSGMAGLQDIAGRYELQIGVAHHTRKMGSDDPLETISGTQGLAGAADTILILRRERANRDAVLFVTGRDVEEAEIALRFDPGRCRWSLLGEELSEERLAVISLLRYTTRALSIKDIALGLGRSYEAVKVLCWRMGNAGQILIEGKGHYSYNPRTSVTPETKETVDTPETGEPQRGRPSTESVSAVQRFQGFTGSEGALFDAAYLEQFDAESRADIEEEELA